MTQTITLESTLESTILEKLQTLTPQQQQSVLDFVDFLQSRPQPETSIEENPAPLESSVVEPQEAVAETNSETPTISAYEMAKEWAGCLESGVGDLSYNKKYLEGPSVK